MEKRIHLWHFSEAKDTRYRLKHKGLKSMKDSNCCPKCKGTNVVRFDGYTGAHGAGNTVMVGMTIMSAVNVNRYICCDCGYTEEWIDKSDLENVKKNIQYSNRKTKN